MKNHIRILIAALLLAVAGRAQERLSPAPEGTFTYAVFSDTHGYSGGGEDGAPLTNAALFSQAAWLANNIESQRIVFVTHAGDIVNNNTAAHYPLAREAFALFHGRVPYGIAPGNHDGERESGTARFQQTFGAERFKAFPWYGGTYAGRKAGDYLISGDNSNSWQTFSAGGLDFVVLHIQCNALDDVLAWADTVLEQNRRRMAIIVTHAYLGPVAGKDNMDSGLGRMRWSKISNGNSPQHLWERCFSKHGNVFLIVSADQASVAVARQESKGADGNVVHEVMANYPIVTERDDWLRLYRFDPEAKVIHAFTYSPAQERLCTGIWHVQWRNQHLFDLDISGAVERFRAQN